MAPLASLPGLPIALFDFSYLDAAVYQKLAPALRTVVVEGLVAVVNWLREMVSAHGLAISRHRVRSTARYLTVIIMV